MVPTILLDPKPLMCINLVLPMGWVNYSDLFYATSETVTDVTMPSSYQRQTPLGLCSYIRPLPHLSLPYYYFITPSVYIHYIDGINCLTQCNQTQHQQLMELILRALKATYLSISNKMKGSVRPKKATAEDRDWQLPKDILEWISNTNDSTSSLSPKRLIDLTQLLGIHHKQRWMSRKKLDRLIDKLQSM